MSETLDYINNELTRLDEENGKKFLNFYVKGTFAIDGIYYNELNREDQIQIINLKDNVPDNRNKI